MELIKNLLAHWNFNEGEGTTLTDLSEMEITVPFMERPGLKILFMIQMINSLLM